VLLSDQILMSAPAELSRPSHARHVVLGLTVAAYMITYMDRTVISTAAPVIRKELGFSLVTMSWVLASFRWSYALFQIPGGWLGDRIGPRRALTLIVSWWSIFTSATAMAWNAASMITIRFLFGIGEAGAFPTATRSLSRWMLPSERGFAQGITHAGSRLGSSLTPPLVVFLIARYGWRSAFVIFGVFGLLWSAIWFVYYRDSPDEHSGVNAGERLLIQSAGERRAKTGGTIPWRQILASPNLLYLSMMYFCYNYSLNTYMDWYPSYLKEFRGYSLEQMGFYASLPFLAGTAGDILGGWLSDAALTRSGNLRLSRRLVAIAGFLACAIATVPAAFVHDAQTSVLFSCLAFFSLELTVGVSWAIPLDIGGDFAGSVSSVMNTWGNIGGAISPTALAYLVRGYGWNVPYLVTAGLCLIAATLYLKIDAGKRIFAESVGG
jgi:MFS transporter, ACS family, glucarate transporter